tara:strand:- start:38148 stop:39362 length:1215 start_codon:yes stop_codon:yes gene_type:complete
MKMTRRSVLKTAAVLPVGGIAMAQASSLPFLPDKTSFEKMATTYLNSASQHPISLKSSAAVETYLAKRRLHPDAPGGRHDSNLPLENFAKLINADFDEVAYVQSTSAGEQAIVRALGYPHSGGHIITDVLHFPGSFATYDGLERMGMAVTRIKERDGRIELEDIKKSLRPDTKFIALSLVAMENGFMHDLKAVCEIAHANDTLVYADIIQGAGTVPIDVKESGIDFAACSSYKWLMGDFGVGFVYASKSAQEHLTQSNFGYFGLNTPREGIGAEEAKENYGFPKSASGHFAIGTRSFTGVAILTESLDYILGLGVDTIHAHSRSMTDRLKEELPKLGYELWTPLDSNGPMVVGKMENAHSILGPRLNAAKIQISVYPDRFRISPSVFNDMDDIERLLVVLKGAV